MQDVIFQRHTPAAAEAIADDFLDSAFSRELVEKLLKGQITGQDYLYLLRNRLESLYDNYAERMEAERQERLRESADEYDGEALGVG